MRGTAGQLLVNSMLPEDLRDYSRRLDAKGMKALAQRIADSHPDKYSGIMHKLMKLGGDQSYYSGNSFGLRHVTTSKAAKKHVEAIRKKIRALAADPKLDSEQRQKEILRVVGRAALEIGADVKDEALADDNPIAVWEDSGVRGKVTEMNQMIGAPLLVTDYKGRPVPIPVLNNYSDGLTPAELFATAAGVRKGYVDIKTGTPKSGYFSKQLANAAHKLLASDEEPPEGVGYEVPADDPDNEGAVLARDYGDFKRGSVITSRMLKSLQAHNKTILVHSPIAAPAREGIPRFAVGVREKGVLPARGENVGIAAAQSISEPLSQDMMSSKHLGGMAVGGGAKGTSVETQGAFGVFERLANIPKSHGEYAPTAEADGRVEKVYPAPQGGVYVRVGGKDYWTPPSQAATVKAGEAVEAGDVLSDGLPNLSTVVRHKGIGEGRRTLVDYMRRILKDGQVGHHRRNVELLSRGLLNHVRVTANDQRLGYLPDDVVEYDRLAASYVPRPGAKARDVGMAGGHYLEAPILHYSIGTRLTPGIVRRMRESGVRQVMTHDAEPEFVPEMQRAKDALAADDDWMVNMAGFNLERNFQKGLQAGKGTRTGGLSYIPDLAEGINFQGFGEE